VSSALELLEHVGVGWSASGVDDLARFVSWLRAPADNVILLESAVAKRSPATVNRQTLLYWIDPRPSRPRRQPIGTRPPLHPLPVEACPPTNCSPTPSPRSPHHRRRSLAVPDGSEVVGRGGPGRSASMGGSPAAQLERPGLLGRQGRPGEREVPLVGDHVPADHQQLAGYGQPPGVSGRLISGLGIRLPADVRDLTRVQPPNCRARDGARPATLTGIGVSGSAGGFPATPQGRCVGDPTVNGV
jgi:hypothetical protein